MTAAGQGNGFHCILAYSVKLRMPGREPSIHLDRQEHTIGNIIALDRVGQRVHVHRPGGRGTRFWPEGRIPIPAQRHEHMITQAAGDRHGCILQRRGRAGAAHMHRGGIAQHIDAQIGRHLLRCRINRGRDHAINVGRLQARIRDGPARCFQHHVDCGILGPFYKSGFANTRNGGLVAEAEGRRTAHACTSLCRRARHSPCNRPGFGRSNTGEPFMVWRPDARLCGRTSASFILIPPLLFTNRLWRMKTPSRHRRQGPS